MLPPKTALTKMPSHWDRLSVELKTKIARMAAFPVGDFEVLHTPLKVYWSELRYQGKVFDLDTGEEVDPRHGLEYITDLRETLSRLEYITDLRKTLSRFESLPKTVILVLLRASKGPNSTIALPVRVHD